MLVNLTLAWVRLAKWGSDLEALCGALEMFPHPHPLVPVSDGETKAQGSLGLEVG